MYQIVQIADFNGMTKIFEGDFQQYKVVYEKQGSKGSHCQRDKLATIFISIDAQVFISCNLLVSEFKNLVALCSSSC